MSEYPKMLYKLEGDTVADYAVAADDGEEQTLRADGFGDMFARDPLDHDGDGRKGGSRRRRAAPAE